MCHPDLYYVLPTVKPGDSIPWSQLSHEQDIRTYECHEGSWQHLTYQGVTFTPIPYCTFGDYDNSSTTERSNVRTVRAEFPWLVHVYGDHGSEMIGYLGKRENQNPRLIEAIQALERYPVYDESDESDLETETAWNDWCSDGRKDFARVLVKLLDQWFTDREHEIDLDDLDENPERNYKDRHGLTLAIDELWALGQDYLNVNGGSGHKFEGGSTYFYTDEWVEKASRYLTQFGAHSDAKVHDALVAFSKQCGYLVPDETDDETDLYVQRALVAIWLGWNGTASPRELVKQCTDVESCSVLGDYLDEHTPTEPPTRQLDMML